VTPPDASGAAGLALELRGITKRFGALTANDAVDLQLRRGEIHALLGENGAGKSTLMNVVYGMLTPDEGEVLVNGHVAHVGSPREAMDLGIGMVFQHFMLIPVMSVAENLVLGAEPRRGGLLDVAGARERTRELSKRYGLKVDPDARVSDVSVGQQQRIEILRALDRGAKILVLDEPTAVLTAQETAELTDVLRGLRDQGTSVVFITHKLHEVLEVADRVTVLRRGKTIGTVDTADADEASLARMMVGRDVVLRIEKEPANVDPARPPLLELEDLHATDDRGLPAVDGVSLAVRPGEIVAIAGIDGNGQSELIDAISGLRPVASGHVRINGKDITNCTPRGAREAGVGHIAEDRQHRGLVLDFSLAENLALNDYRAGSRFGLLNPKRIVGAASRLLQEFDVRGGTPATPARSLSGGNQQKVVIAREVSGNPDALIAAQPTRGLDVGAIEFVHRRLLAERDQGRAILLFSLELDEVRSLADRILVIYDGRIVGELPPTASDEELGLMMTGSGTAGGTGATAP
jgi:general nucleoside transport system ATP-binding protein